MLAVLAHEPGISRAELARRTDAGHAVLADAYPVVEVFNRDSFSALTDREGNVMARLLRKLIAA
jgi:hypothetical protein